MGLDPLSPQSRNKLLFFNKVFWLFLCPCGGFRWAFGGRDELGEKLRMVCLDAHRGAAEICSACRFF